MKNKREEPIAGCDLKRLEAGRGAKVMKPDGSWWLTSPVISYFVTSGFIIIETMNTIYISNIKKEGENDKCAEI